MGDLKTSEAINLTVSGTPGRSLQGRPSQRHTFTPYLLEELRLAYVGNKRQVSANLTRLSTRYEMPRTRLTREARRQGWQIETRRPWTAEEDAFLLAGVGKINYRKMAAGLGRSWHSVEARLRKLQQSPAGQAATYDVDELAGLFGVGLPKVRKWIACGLFGSNPKSADGADRIPCSLVARFLRKHVCEYSFERVNQSWFKAVVFCDGEHQSPGKDK